MFCPPLGFWSGNFFLIAPFQIIAYLYLYFIQIMVHVYISDKKEIYSDGTVGVIVGSVAGAVVLIVVIIVVVACIMHRNNR